MSMNSWEAEAYTVQHDSYIDSQQALFHPTIYSTQKELDIMRILTSIYIRPNQKLEIGPVDMSCPIIVCDLEQRDEPIVYANEPFLHMTGYRLDEVLGRNCRFLQTPGGKPRRNYVPCKDTTRKMRKAIDRRVDIQLEVDNFKKNGTKFRNILTMIPLEVDGMQLCVGLQYEVEQ